MRISVTEVYNHVEEYNIQFEVYIKMFEVTILQFKVIPGEAGFRTDFFQI